MKIKCSFTLVEIMVVIAVIGILAGMALGVASLAASKNADTRTKATFTMIVQALEQYKQKYGYYPYLSSGYTDFNLGKDSNDTSKIKDGIAQFLDYGYIKKNGTLDGTAVVPWDGYKHAFKYKYPGTRNPASYDLLSLGPDGKYGDNSTDSSNAGKGDDYANFKRKN